MNYEQKYKEALNDMRVIYPNLKGDAKLAVEHAFPELAESEDEGIRKAIGAAICGATAKSILEANGTNLPDALAYLEKLKEHVPENGKMGTRTEQNPAEWSEEDEKMVLFWNMYYEHKVGDWPNKDVVEHLERFQEWLYNRFRSLRPQPKQEMAKEVF